MGEHAANSHRRETDTSIVGEGHDQLLGLPQLGYMRRNPTAGQLGQTIVVLLVECDYYCYYCYYCYWLSVVAIVIG